MNVSEFLKNDIVLLDGAMGSLLQKRGLLPGERPELWNLTHSDDIVEIHREYFDAGSNIVNTNTFGANLFNYSEDELDKIARCAIANARKAAELSEGKQTKLVSFDMGPSGKLLKPYGELEFEDCVKNYTFIASLAEKYGADLVTIETFNDGYETKAAVLGVKEGCKLPVIVSNAYNDDGNLLTGASPEAMVAMLEGLGVDAVGLNCSYGPDKLMDTVRRIAKASNVPVIFKPNAGLPVVVNGRTVYNLTPEYFSDCVAESIDYGVSIIGGCCGTDPDYIRLLKQKTESRSPVIREKNNDTVVSCNTHSVLFKDRTVIIGERINPTGKKFVKQALRDRNIDYLINQGIEQIRCGADVLDVNCGLPEINEPEVLTETVLKLQSVCDAPLQLDTSDPEALESAMRVYNGKPMINSVNGKQESMDSVFPLVEKYGGLLVCLTLDENGIPDNSIDRLHIAEKIISEAERYGIEKKNLVFDPLCMTISTDNEAAKVTLDSVKLITEATGCKTILGVSNVSFGLPAREKINSVFFTLAMYNGLSGAIINPQSKAMMDAYRSFCAVTGKDANCLDYINYIGEVTDENINKSEEADNDLRKAIVEGRGDKAADLTSVMLKDTDSMTVVNDYLIPALDLIGRKFEKKEAYLPQLLLSAEAAKKCFEVIKKSSVSSEKNKFNIVLATVKGDIHDIGKNIVKLLLENYGYNVIDLGKDVSPEDVLKAAIDNSAPVVGLSALMTTTVPAMEDTIRLLHKEIPSCKVVVGGAVLTQEYADSIGADYYSADAMETVRFAESLL